MDRMPVITLALAMSALIAGCGSEPKPAPRLAAVPMVASDAAPRAWSAPPARQDISSPTSGSVQIDERIRRACGDLPEARFAFDSASVDARAAAALDALARCLSTGPLAGHQVRLIGHADPRGEVEYNLALGQRRAGNVADYLAQRGVQRGKLSLSSRGEFDADGTDEEGWARDRKVDVILAD